MLCPSSQAPLAGPIGLQRLFSIFSQFATGENGHDINPTLGRTAAALSAVLCSQESSLCLLSPLAPCTYTQVFSFSQMCAALSSSPQPLSWFPASLGDGSVMGRLRHGCRHAVFLTGQLWAYGSSAPKMPGIRGSQAGKMHPWQGFFLCLFALCFQTVNLLLRPSAFSSVF